LLLLTKQADTSNSFKIKEALTGDAAYLIFKKIVQLFKETITLPKLTASAKWF
jgi:hypothetical protein